MPSTGPRTLIEIRSLIDALDGELVGLLARRPRLVRAAAGVRADGRAVRAPDRAERVIAAARAGPGLRGWPERSRTLRRHGFTPQRHARRSYRQQDAQVRAWLEEAYPAIAARARREKAELVGADQCGLRSDTPPPEATGRSPCLSPGRV
ncbi:chorismate mutase [Streptomyces sp. NPDC048383]|uniref:chorismate mutase n=1 Tax=Streptomyces sp. NPDC048383 TaxID=3155386 RepID=UPI0034395AE9